MKACQRTRKLSLLRQYYYRFGSLRRLIANIAGQIECRWKFFPTGKSMHFLGIGEELSAKFGIHPVGQLQLNPGYFFVDFAGIQRLL